MSDVIKLTFEEMKEIGFDELTDYCRMLLDEAYDPNTRVELYRGSTLCLVAKRIEDAAKFKVEGSYFKKYRGKRSRKANSLVATGAREI